MDISKTDASAYFVLMAIFAALTVPLPGESIRAQGLLANDAKIFWCPMRGAPCKLEDYDKAGRCNDCGMPLVTKATYLERKQKTDATKKTLGVVLYPGFELLDVFGPMEMFAYAPGLNVILIAQEAGKVKSGQGPEVIAEYGFEDAPKLDIILVPGGQGTYRELGNETMLEWLKDRAAIAEITTSVCTGSAILAKAGILDGKRATSNKQFFTLATQQSDKVDWVWEARWVDDGNVITSSGVSAGMDMALHLIQRLFGAPAAEAIAEGTEYEWHEDADRDPFAKRIKRR